MIRCCCHFAVELSLQRVSWLAHTHCSGLTPACSSTHQCECSDPATEPVCFCLLHLSCLFPSCSSGRAATLPHLIGQRRVREQEQQQPLVVVVTERREKWRRGRLCREWRDQVRMLQAVQQQSCMLTTVGCLQCSASLACPVISFLQHIADVALVHCAAFRRGTHVLACGQRHQAQ